MKFFLDTAHLESIVAAYNTGLIQGVTTNPTHLSKVQENPVQLVQRIAAQIYPGEVSVEITEKDPRAVYAQAVALAAIAPNIVVKIPCDRAYLEIIDQLVKEGIRLNITLVFSVAQGLCMAKLRVGYISPFIGRLEDSGDNGIQLIKDLKTIYREYNFTTEILAASIRTHFHLYEAALAGADVATIPITLFETLVDHPLTKKGMDLFDQSWQQLALKKFP